MKPGDRQLITAETFKTLARKGATASDFADKAVLKSGLIDVKAVGAEGSGRTIGFILSNANLDREGDSISVKGWDLGPYELNPVVLWAHDHGALPVGKATKTYIDGPQLKAIDEFADKDLYPFADTVYRMLQGGYLNACSVGFQPMEWEMSDTGVNFEKQGLLEHSVCPVPAHPEALVIARSKGIDVAPLKEWAEKTLDLFRGKKLGDGDELVREQLQRLRAQTDPKGRKLFTVLRGVKLPSPAIVDEKQPEFLALEASADDIALDAIPVEVKDDVLVPVPVAPVADPDANVAADQTAYQTMASMLAEVGTACSEAASAVGELLSTPEPVAGDPAGEADEAGSDRDRLDAVLSNCQAAMTGLSSVADLAQSILAGKPDEEQEPIAAAPALALAAPAEIVTSKAWNPRLSKAFDIARVRLEPGSVELALVSRYLGVDMKQVEVRRTSIPAYRMGSWLTAIDEELGDWQTEDVRNLNWEGEETPPSYENIQLNSAISNDFMVDGIRFLRQPGDPELRMVLAIDPSWYGLDLAVYGVRETGTAGHSLGKMSTKAKTINFLKGEAFALCGEFLPKTSETFDDLFLESKNQTAMTRIVSLINEKGITLENRGVLALGPPGTGKTLSARIMRNLAKCTFIWVSSRDFHYAGAFGGITEAFDLARECAPSIIVFEDIDNWLSGYSMDLLKTELDGVSRSSGVVTMMTTNYPEMLPAALLDRPGRFHDVLRFDLPDDRVRKAMLLKWLPGLDEVTAIKAVDATKGYSGAHIRELARFATIIGEQDALDLPMAVERALEKLAEQRELINDSLATGSRYRAPSENMAVRKVIGGGKGAAAPVLKGLENEAQQEAAVENADRLAKLRERVDAPEERVAEVPVRRQTSAADGLVQHRQLMECASWLLEDFQLTPAQKAIVKAAQKELHSVALDFVKVGRVLSSANEERIKKAGDLLKEVLSQLESAPEAPETPEVAAADFLLLDEEIAARRALEPIEMHGLTAEDVRGALERVLGEQMMLVTGRVD